LKFWAPWPSNPLILDRYLANSSYERVTGSSEAVIIKAHTSGAFNETISSNHFQWHCPNCRRHFLNTNNHQKNMEYILQFLQCSANHRFVFELHIYLNQTHLSPIFIISLYHRTILTSSIIFGQIVAGATSCHIILKKFFW